MLFMVLIFVIPRLFADNMSDGHALGANYASGQLGAVQGKAQSTSVGDIPGFKTATPPETSLDNGSIGDAAMKVAQSNEAATYISEHSSKRQSFKIDPNTDPMMVNANKAMANPEKTMDEIVIETPEGKGDDEIVFCEESGDEYSQKCSKHLEIKIQVTPEIKTIKRWCNGHPNPSISAKNRYHRDNLGWCNGCQTQVIVSQERKVEIISEEWVDGCKALEAQSDAGLCRYESEVDGDPETRTIVGAVVNPEVGQPNTDSELIKRDSWQKHYTYKCLKKVEGDCHKLSARGCVQIASTCSQKIGNVCVAYKQTYRCPNTKKKQIRYKAVGEKTPFCFTGDCVDTDYEANGELANAMSHLAILKEAQDDIRANLGIFKGQGRRCRKAWKGARDCCGSGNRWAVTWKMAPGCDSQEKELGDWRAKRRCVEVGTYCAQKLPIIGCIEKKTTFCCFGTKLSKLIQEQGRRQLGMSWGSPESPECRGLSPEELSRLDFSKMDLSELFEDVVNNFKPKSQDHIAKGLELERIRENMKHLSGSREGNQERARKLEADNQKIAELQALKANAEITHTRKLKELDAKALEINKLNEQKKQQYEMNLPQMIKDLEQEQKQYAPYIIPEYRGFITFRPQERHPGNPQKYAELENQIKQLHKPDSYKTTNNYQQLKAAYQDTLKDKDKSLQEFTKEQKAIDAEIQKITQNQKKASL